MENILQNTELKELLKTFHQEPNTAVQAQPNDNSEISNSIQGTPAAPGLAQGRALVLTPTDGFPVFTGPTILVCRTLTRAYLDLIPRVQGLVVENAGLLSTPLNLARQFGIPSVVGAPGAVDGIKNGDWLSVNGSTGIVEKAAI
jgi:pyruvate,water dikinase